MKDPVFGTLAEQIWDKIVLRTMQCLGICSQFPGAGLMFQRPDITFSRVTKYSRSGAAVVEVLRWDMFAEDWQAKATNHLRVDFAAAAGCAA